MTESYSSSISPDIKGQVESLEASILNIDELINRLRDHSLSKPLSSPDVTDEDTLYGPSEVYDTVEGDVLETDIQMPVSGKTLSLIISGTSLILPELTLTARVDTRYPVTMYINIVTVAGEENVEVDTSQVGRDSVKNPEIYDVEVVESEGVYTLTFPSEVSCIDIVRSRGLISQSASTTREYRTASSLTSMMPGNIQRTREVINLDISESFVEDAPYTLFYIHEGRNTYVVDEGNVVLIKGRAPASSLASGEYVISRESVTYKGKVLLQGADVRHRRGSGYVQGTVLERGDVLVNDQGRTALVMGEGSVSESIGSASLLFSSQIRLRNSVALVDLTPGQVDMSSQVNNEKLAEIYEYTTRVENYVSSVRRCCDSVASLPVEYPIVNEMIRLHRRTGYDRAADLISELMLDDYMSVSESESSYESMLAEHTKTMQVKVLT